MRKYVNPLLGSSLYPQLFFQQNINKNCIQMEHYMLESDITSGRLCLSPLLEVVQRMSCKLCTR